MRMRHTLAALIALTATFAATFAAAESDADVIKALERTLRARFPDVPVVDIRPAPLAGLYEVFTGETIVYADRAGDHLLIGSLMETATKRNLSVEGLDERNSIDFESLPLDLAIKVVKGDGRRRLAVFTDPDCPYCQQLEKELATLDDITVYSFLLPVESLHPQARARSQAIWCAPDRALAWSQWMLQRKAPQGEACKEDPLEKLQALGQKLRIASTPTLFLANGRRVSGSFPAAQLEQHLQSADTRKTAQPAEALH